MKICPLAPFTLDSSIENIDDALAIVTLNNKWQAQGCKSVAVNDAAVMTDCI